MAPKSARASDVNGHDTAQKKRKALPDAKVAGDLPTKKPRLWDAKGKDKSANPSSSQQRTASKKGPNQTPQEVRAQQKQLAQERKAAKPLADEVQRTKKIWEKLRRKSHVPPEERQALLQELYAIITGRVKDFVLKHDAVRAVQTALKYSTAEQRRQIAKELQGTYAQLAESRYAKFLVGKLLSQPDPAVRDIIVPEFYGKVRRLINHPEASWILDDIYRGAATAEQKSQLLREWYGPEFALIKPTGLDATADLAKIFEDAPSKRATVLKHLFDTINSLVQKKMTGFTMLHDAMLQYFLNTKPGSDERNEFVEVVKADENGDLLKNMAFTKPGARLVCLLLAHGSSKDRRQLLKTFKDTFNMMSGDAHAHMILLAAYDVIDDTVLTSKTIFPELLGKSGEQDTVNAIFLANDIHARKAICYLFEGRSKALFPSPVDPDLFLLDEIKEIREKTSKKDPETRHRELVAAMSPHLLSVVALSAGNLVSSSFGCQLVTHTLLLATGDKTEALKAIAETAAGAPTQVDDEEEAYPSSQPHISLSSHASRMFKTLISGGRFDKKSGVVKQVDPPLKFADVFYPVIKDHIVKWATGPSSFAVLALVEAADFSAKDELCETLKTHKEDLERAQKGDAEVNPSNQKKAEEKGKSKVQDGKLEGNMGSRLLLERLFASET